MYTTSFLAAKRNRQIVARPQKKIPCMIMRGGTLKGPYFLAEDLPADD